MTVAAHLPNGAAGNWTAERTELLRERWSAGINVVVIAAELGIGRNAVVGKAHRLGLPEHKAASESTWNDTRVTLLRKLWSEGASPGQIARDLGGVSRRALMVKAKRLGLPERETIVIRRPTPKVSRLPAPLPEHAEPGDMPVGERITSIVDLQAAECRWPLGDLRRGTLRWCGCRTDGGIYCATHTRISRGG